MVFLAEKNKKEFAKCVFFGTDSRNSNDANIDSNGKKWNIYYVSLSKFIVSTKRTFNWTEKIFGTFISKVSQKNHLQHFTKKSWKKYFDVTKIWRSKGPIRHFQISFYVTFRAQSFTSLNADLHQETSIGRREKLYLLSSSFVKIEQFL